MSLKIKPPKSKKFWSNQSNAGDHMMETPSRGIFLGPGSSGKTLTAQVLLTKFYKDVFAAIFIWSPTARLDKGWDVVFEEMVKMGQEPEATSGDKQCVFTTFDAADFNRITREHTKLVEKLKDQKQKPGGSQEIPSILFLCDDFADQADVVRRSGFVTSFIRLRHQFISCWILSQKWKLLAPAIRVNLTFVLCWRLRSTDEETQFLKDIGGKHGYEVTKRIYDLATSEKYSFLYYDALKNEFFVRFEQRVNVE